MKLQWIGLAIAAGLPAFGSLVNMNTSDPFALVGATITTTGASMVQGNVAAMNSVTSGPGLTAMGTVSASSDPTAMQAYTNFQSAFNSADWMASTASFSGLSNSQTFMANSVTTFSSSNVSTGSGVNLTFNAENNANAIFVIRTSGALNINGGLTFTLENGAQASNIYWIVGTTANLNMSGSGPAVFDGNILAGQNVSLSTGEGMFTDSINGCVFANDSISLSGSAEIGGCSFSADAIDAPEPGTAALFGLGGILCFIGFAWPRLRRAVQVR